MDAVEANGIRLVSGYEILSLEEGAEGLSAKLKIPEDMPGYVIVLTDGEAALRKNGVALAEMETLDIALEGYRRLESGKGYAIKLRGGSNVSVLTISG